MSSSKHVQAPPGMGTVHRATLDAMALRGPRRVGVTHIARLADSNRQFFYRNWASPQVLLREATLQELKRVLERALEVPSPLPPRECLGVRFVVRAARLLREHPVVAAMARTEPTMTYAAVLRTDTEWHGIARQWLTEHVTPHLPRGTEQDTVTPRRAHHGTAVRTDPAAGALRGRTGSCRPPVEPGPARLPRPAAHLPRLTYRSCRSQRDNVSTATPRTATNARFALRSRPARSHTAHVTSNDSTTVRMSATGAGLA
ncbi:TetR/AcrR family transcriptional regulator [Streptomyces sp. L7]